MRFASVPLSVLSAACVAISYAFAPISSHAESNPFFERHAARTVFGESARVVVGGKIPDSFKDQGPSAAVLNNDSKDSSSIAADQTERTLSQDARSRILKEFGDPNVPTPLRAVDDAPTPFKGLLAALDAGDEQLAQQYAEQWHSYMRRLKAGNERAVSLVLNTERKIASEAQQQAEAAAKQELGTEDISAVASKINANGLDPEGPALLDALGQNARTQIFVFFQSGDPRSGEAARQVDAFVQQFGKRYGASVLGVNADYQGHTAALEFKQRYGISFPVVASRELATSLGVSELPTIAIVAPGAKKAVLKSGQITAQELKQIFTEGSSYEASRS